MVLVDSNVLLDIVTNDPVWLNWSASTMKSLSRTRQLVIDPVIYAEVSIAFSNIADLETTIHRLRLNVEEIPRAALFLAGKAFLQYRKRGGTKSNVLPDFFIGAHASVLGISLLTRDASRYLTYFPSVSLLTP